MSGPSTLRRIGWAAAGVAVAALVVAVVGPRFVDAEPLRATAERALSDALGTPVRLQRLTWRLLPRPSIATAKIEAGSGFEAQRVELPLSVGALLAGRVRPVGIAVRGARIGPPEHPWLVEAALDARLRFLENGAVEVDGQLRGRQGAAGADPLDARFDGRILGFGGADAHFEGRVRAPRVVMGGAVLEAFEAPLRWGAGGLVSEDLRFRLCGGVHGGSLVIDTSRTAGEFRYRSKLEGLALGECLAALDSELRDAVQGTGELRTDVRGSLGDLGSIRGTVRLEVREGRFASAALFLRAAERAGRGGGSIPEIADATFESLSATFVVDRGVATTEDLALRSRWLDGDGHGTIGLDGSLDLRVEASTAMAGTRWTVPLRIVGTVREPDVQLDLGGALGGSWSDRLLDGLERWFGAR